MTPWNRATAPQLAADLIARTEAFRERAYQDSVGVWTVGYGTTVMPNGKRVQPGDVLPEPSARALLRQQCGAWAAALCRHVSGALDENQAAVMISFVHNLGEGALRSSTIAAMLNANRPDLAGWQLGGWVMAGGQKALGLMRRRELERRIFFGAGIGEYDAVWKLGQAALEPAYARAFRDAENWRLGSVPVAPTRPAPRPVARQFSAPLSEADRLNDAALASARQG